MANSGKSFAEIVESGVAADSYVKNTFTKNGLDWRKGTIVIMDEKEDIPDEALESILETPAKEESEIDASMAKMEEEKEAEVEKDKKLDALHKLAEHLGLGDVLSELTAPKKKEVRVLINKCTRHPDMVVRPGDNCEKCIFDSQKMEADLNRRDFVLPCPKCGDNKRQKDGGTIKKLPRAGHYSCGNCKTSYNTSGEQCKWGDKDASLFNKALARGQY
jgi:hypothetical protein